MSHKLFFKNIIGHVAMGDWWMCGELVVAFTSAYKPQKDLWLLASCSGLIDMTSKGPVVMHSGDKVVGEMGKM